jgi:hypothetical protein
MTETVSLTRQELYNRVWQTPMVKIAAEYGISGRGLAKLCERHGIPVPGRGHWAIKAAGYEVEPDPLPADPSPDTPVQITGDPRPEKEEHPDVAAQIAYEAEHPIVVPEHLHRPHRLVTGTRESLRPSRPGAIGTPPTPGGILEIQVSRQQQPRALRIFDALLKACEERGFSIVVEREPQSRAKIKVRGEELSVSITEPNRRTDHVLSAREQEEQRKGRGWLIPRYDFTPKGTLIFTIDGWTEGLQHRWSDRKNRPLEKCLNDIIIGMVRIVVTVLIPRRLEAVRQHQLRLEEDRRRQIYRAKMDALNKALEGWQQSQGLRRFVAVVDEAAQRRLGTILENSPINEWLCWARDLADRIDPLDDFIERLANQAPPGGDAVA